jgi:low temperature requirement protein LtrA
MSDTRASTSSASSPRLLRERVAGGHGKVTNIELFFDLVFVYGVTQLSHALLHDLSLLGAAHVLLLFLAVWWVWIFTGWVTNWLDPDRIVVRAMMLALTFAGLLLSASLPEAFEERGLLFAGAYVAMQVGRSLFMVWALRHGGTAGHRRNFTRILLWLAAAGVGWLIGAWHEGPARFAWWIAALGLEYLGPAAYFYVPGLGRSTTADWDVEGGHFAERCSLFVIIALGESLVVTGSSFASSQAIGEVAPAFVAAFLGCVAMWWIYFDLGAERGSHAIQHSADPGRTARLAYTYLHLPIVAGIVVSAVGDELSLSHPHARGDMTSIAVLIGGPVLYLLGNALFKMTVNRTHFPLSHLVGLVLLVFLVAPAFLLSVFWIAALTTVVLLLVAVWETWALRAWRARLAGEEAH